MNLLIGPYRLDIHAEVTRVAYAALPTLGESCTCMGCRNFDALVRAGHLPAAVSELFDALGIDPAKPAEMSAYTSLPDGRVLYGGFYHLCATLLEGESAWVPTAGNSDHLHWESGKAIPLAEEVEICFSLDCLLLEEGFPAPTLQLELEAKLPWVLEEANTY